MSYADHYDGCWHDLSEQIDDDESIVDECEKADQLAPISPSRENQHDDHITEAM